MNCNSNNPCMGIYGKCLDVKITNICNGNCDFCIEKDGLKTEDVSVQELISSTNNQSDYQKILILGGEPFLYSYLCEYIEGIKNKEEIYITTNGSKFTKKVLNKISKYLTGINISIHHYDEQINSNIIKTKVSFNNIKDSIVILKENGVSVRINANLIKNGIDNKEKAYTMILFAKLLGANSIRFAELQNCPELYVSASSIFDNINLEPFEDGCEQTLNVVEGIEVKVRLTCGIVNPSKNKPKNIKGKESETKVMYTNSELYNGWLNNSGSCHGRSDGCH